MPWSDVMEGLRDGDVEARDRVARLVIGTLEAIGAYGIRDSWDDLVQEVLIALLEKPPDAGDDAAILAYVRRTTQRRAVDWIRRERGRRRATGEGPSGWRRSVPLDEVERELRDEGRFERRLDLGLRRALASLDERRRRILECKYALGCTDAEGAERLGEALGTYKRLVREAIAELRAQLVPREPGEGDG